MCMKVEYYLHVLNVIEKERKRQREGGRQSHRGYSYTEGKSLYLFADYSLLSIKL